MSVTSRHCTQLPLRGQLEAVCSRSGEPDGATELGSWAGASPLNHRAHDKYIRRIRRRHAARQPPSPNLVARCLLWGSSFCERQIVDQGFAVGVCWLVLGMILAGSWQVLGGFLAVRFVTCDFDDLQIYIPNPCQNP